MEQKQRPDEKTCHAELDSASGAAFHISVFAAKKKARHFHRA